MGKTQELKGSTELFRFGKLLLDFISTYAAKAKPLIELTKGNRTFEWSVEAQQFCKLLKQEFCAEPVLGLADNERAGMEGVH